MNSLMQEAVEWCKGRNWVLRAPLLAYFAYVFIRHLRDPLYTSILGGLNLGIHELGHMVSGFLGESVSVAGGTILQLAVPVFAFFNFYRQRDFFAIALTFGWLSTNFFNVATYVADARKMELPLVSIGGGGVYHDWQYMLSGINALEYDTGIAVIIRLFAVFSMLACFISGAWLLLQMAANSREAGENYRRVS
ncbi:MAG: hypothetical protein MUC52_00985 [Candidatus Omnitrophica bacterium]|nr:hypothetical protein [Candidatus Omnitrophota bacterium]